MKTVITNNGIVLSEGDFIETKTSIIINGKSVPYITHIECVNAEYLNNLIANNIAYEYKKVIDMDEITDRLAKKFKLSFKEMVSYMDNLMSIHPVSGLELLLMEIAIKLDEKYSDHISRSPLLYYMDIIEGRIKLVHKELIKSYKNIALFRTIDDAKIACRTVKPILKHMYNSGK